MLRTQPWENVQCISNEDSAGNLHFVNCPWCFHQTLGEEGCALNATTLEQAISCKFFEHDDRLPKWSRRERY